VCSVTHTPPPHLYTLSLHDALPIFNRYTSASTRTLPGSTSRVRSRGRSHAESAGISHTATTSDASSDSTTVNAIPATRRAAMPRSEEHTSELQSRENLVCRLLLEKK